MGYELDAEHAALRRIAARVARGGPPEAVFATVLEEAGRLLAVDYVRLGRYEPDDTLAVVASWGNVRAAAPRTLLGGRNPSMIVFETGRSARLDSYDDASGPRARPVFTRRWLLRSPSKGVSGAR